MADRWMLNRAGIVNVYQYGDEVLHFAGGRLLLRGVNGSGKSTAMNMLLPFLVDADVRRIDAAGEQTRVLHSWMLNGRDEQQPVGYLWIEFARGEHHLTCGCGIRANRSTDNVNTWWFVTDLRPGIDFQLVEQRVPLSSEGLRNAIGSAGVFPKDQRQAYRAEVRARLFGGGDLDQHIRLLHAVRSPRVGDRIDSELPSYLDEALPQLSESAVDEAAQPLEDLDEHRRNVAELTTTAESLDALAAVYRSYAAGDVRRRATHALRLVDESDRAHQAERAALRAVERAGRERDEARERVAQLEADELRFTRETQALREQPAYRDGAKLVDLRSLVDELRRALTAAESDVVGRRRAADVAEGSARQAEADASNRLDQLTHALTRLGELATAAGLAARPIDPPPVARSGELPIDGPADVPDVAPLRAAVGSVLAATKSRRADIDDVNAAIAGVESKEQALGEAERRLHDAEAKAERAEAERTRCETAVADLVESARSDLSAWLSTAIALPLPDDRPSLGLDHSIADRADLHTHRDDIRSELFTAFERFVDELRTEAAAVRARRDVEADESDRLELEVERLASTEDPEPPTAHWQQRTGPALSRLVDFHDDVPEDTRLGIEAALEASGLLAATVTDEGATFQSGELVAVATDPVGSPLTDLLRVDMAAPIDGVSAGLVERLLGSLSYDPASGATNVIARDGSFRIGALRGRHSKTEVEHVGATARLEALQRMRAAATDALDTALRRLEATNAELDALDTAIRAALDHRDRLPHFVELDRADAAFAHAAALAASALDAAEAAQAERNGCERNHAESVDSLRRLAATLALPSTRAGLADVSHAVDDAALESRRADDLVNAWVQSVEFWMREALRAVDATNDLAAAIERSEAAQLRLEPEAARLATLEDAMGADYDEIVKALSVADDELRGCRRELKPAREHESRLVDAYARAEAGLEQRVVERESAERACVDELPRLRAALEVPGLRAALGGDTPSITVTTASTDGLRSVADQLLASVRPPDSETNAEGVRQSLRQRRDRLGHNWDAQDSQQDESLPLSIEITGPLGRFPLAEAAAHVRNQLDEQSGLLTAKQSQALRNLLQGLVAKEVATKLQAATDLVRGMNARLESIATGHGIGVRLRWRRRDDLGEGLDTMLTLLAKLPDLRTDEEDQRLTAELSARIEQARVDNPEAPYRQLIAEVMDYRRWHEMGVLLVREGGRKERLTRRTALSEGEKKVVSYLPLFAAVAASYDALAEAAPDAPRFVLLDDAFAKVSEDNHPKLFGLLVELDLDFIATSERLWGTHATVPELAITEVVRDARSGVIMLEHARWDGRERSDVP